MKVAEGVESIDDVKAFRYLIVTAATLWAERSRRSAESIFRCERKGRSAAIANPDLEHALSLECSDEKPGWRIVEFSFCEELPQRRLFEVAGLPDPLKAHL